MLLKVVFLNSFAFELTSRVYECYFSYLFSGVDNIKNLFI